MVLYKLHFLNISRNIKHKSNINNLINIYLIWKPYQLSSCFMMTFSRSHHTFCEADFYFTSAVLRFICNYHETSLNLVTTSWHNKVSLHNTLCKKDPDIPCFMDTNTIIFLIWLTTQPSNKSSKQPTNSMAQGPSLKADSHSASQEFHTFYETKRFITVFTTVPSLSLTSARLI